MQDGWDLTPECLPGRASACISDLHRERRKALGIFLTSRIRALGHGNGGLGDKPEMSTAAWGAPSGMRGRSSQSQGARNPINGTQEHHISQRSAPCLWSASLSACEARGEPDDVGRANPARGGRHLIYSRRRTLNASALGRGTLGDDSNAVTPSRIFLCARAPLLVSRPLLPLFLSFLQH